jgi:endonuclease/exonuclease/phosphatase family metal-dependent hydrolase
MKTRAGFLTILAALLGAVALSAAPAGAVTPPTPSVKVMTWNLFPGFDDEPVIVAAMSGDEQALVEAGTVAWKQIHDTDFQRRVRDIAGWIRLAGPDIVAVQEAAHYVAASSTGAEVETIDFLEILVAAVRDAGASYGVASVTENFEVTLPAVLEDGNVGFVTLLDRDAILVKSKNSRIAVSNPKNGRYQYYVGPPAFPLTLTRGWASIDVAIGEKSFRFVTSHLEDVSVNPTELTPLQEAQAMEMVAIGTDEGRIPAVFAGDFNTDGFRKWDTYRLLTGDLGLTDAWTTAWPRLPGLTWGNSPDLLNRFPKFTQRLDLALFSGPFTVVDAAVIGAASSRPDLSSSVAVPGGRSRRRYIVIPPGGS